MGWWRQSSVRRWGHGAGEPPSDGRRVHADDVPAGQRHGRLQPGQGGCWVPCSHPCAAQWLTGTHQVISAGNFLFGFGPEWQPGAWSRYGAWTLFGEGELWAESLCIQSRLTQREADLLTSSHVLDFFLSPRAFVQLKPNLLRPAQAELLAYDFIPAWNFSQS